MEVQDPAGRRLHKSECTGGIPKPLEESNAADMQCRYEMLIDHAGPTFPGGKTVAP